MRNRSISRVLYASPVDMGGLPVRQPFPGNETGDVDPFLLLHHAKVKVPKYTEVNHAGVAPHPHRGFSPVTFIFEGGVHHRDSRGNDSIVYAGGVQWMQSGMGIIHSERPPFDIHEKGGVQEIIQLWINTPAKNKMDQPVYQSFQNDEITSAKLDEGKIQLNVFAGEILTLHGPVSTVMEVNAATLFFEQNGKVEVPIPATHQVFIYLLDGRMLINGTMEVNDHHAVIFDWDGDQVSLEAKEKTRILMMSAVPLQEPVVAQGPFVMNTETQILEAMRDYRMGKMGVLIED